MEDKYIRKVQTSVTNFIYCGDYYLFLHRNENKRIDPNRLNGIGGRVEPGEDYLSAAIRETEEETGYKVSSDEVTLAGVVKLEDGYDEDWVMCFFKIKVDSMDIPIGEDTDDGKLVWLHKDEVLNSKIELVDDLYSCFEDVVKSQNIFFITHKLDDKQKVVQSSIRKLKR